MKEKFDFRSIKTINDACEKAGIDFNSFMAIIDPLPEHLRALAAMEVIIKALNDGWENPLDGKTWCYYPWIYVYDNIEMAEVLRENPGREDLIRFKRPDGSCGLAYVLSYYAWSLSSAIIGSRLACKDRETCLYLVQNFKDLLAMYYLPMEGSNVIERYIR